MSTPAEHVREHLAASRRAGLPWAEAWAEATAAALEPDDGWRAALSATRSAWRRSYVGEAPGRAEVVVGMLGEHA